MTAQELRIGNYVNSINHNGFYEWEISAFYEVVTGQSSIDDFKPIPLTEEWLLKFGFTKGLLKILETDLYLQWCEYEKGLYLSTDVGNGKVDDPNTHIEGNFKYVHQLQNLYFALTGEELTLKKIPNE